MMESFVLTAAKFKWLQILQPKCWDNAISMKGIAVANAVSEKKWCDYFIAGNGRATVSGTLRAAARVRVKKAEASKCWRKKLY